MKNYFILIAVVLYFSTNAQILEHLNTANSPLVNFKANSLAVKNLDVYISDSSKYIYRYNTALWYTDSLPDSPNGPNMVRKLIVGRDSSVYAICDSAIYKKTAVSWILKGYFSELSAGVTLIDKNGDIWLLPSQWQTNTLIRHFTDTSVNHISIKASTQQSGMCNEALINDSLVIWVSINNRTYRIINDSLISCFYPNPNQRNLALDDSSRVFAYAIFAAEDIKRIDQNDNLTGIWYAKSLPTEYHGSGFCYHNNYYSMGLNLIHPGSNIPEIIRVDPNIQNLVSSYDFVSLLPTTHQNIFYDGLIVDEYEGIWFLGIENQHNNIYCYRPAYTLKNRVAGRVFFDANANGIKEQTEIYVPSVTIRNQFGNSETKTDNSGYFEFNLLFPGNNIIVPDLGYYWQVTTPSALSIYQSFVGQQDTSIMIGIWAPSFNDLNISGSSGIIRRGFNSNYILSVQNFSLAKQYNIQTTIEIPVLLSYVAVLPQADSVVGNTLWLNIDSLDVFEIKNIYITAYCPPSVSLGTQVSLLAFISCASDTFNSNDTVDVLRYVTGSYDPNNKIAQPDFHEPLFPGEAIIYTINFQNTGNDTTFTVLLRDTIDIQLDLNSFVFMGSSHICSYSINQNRELMFLFQNIQLPDSSVNFIESMGFVTYSIKPDIMVPPGSSIFNTANIYFDFNSAITTNTTNTMIYTSVNEVQSSLRIKCFPNPVNYTLSLISETVLPKWDILLLDIHGRVIFRTCKMHAADKFEIHLPESISSGTYMLKVSTGTSTAMVKIIKI